ASAPAPMPVRCRSPAGWRQSRAWSAAARWRCGRCSTARESPVPAETSLRVAGQVQRRVRCRRIAPSIVRCPTMAAVRLLLPLLALLAATDVLAQGTVDRAKNDHLSHAPKDAPDILAPFAKARAPLDEFLALAKSPPADTTSFALKVGVREGRFIEYFWVNEFAQNGETFSGRINNTPR